MDSRDPVVVFFEKSVIQSITLLRKWDFIHIIVKKICIVIESNTHWYIKIYSKYLYLYNLQFIEIECNIKHESPTKVSNKKNMM